MKNFKRILSCFLAVLMLLTCAPINESVADMFRIEAKAVNATYNATAAARYAKQYALSYNREWYFYSNGGDCANFVSQCLYMGGLPMTDRWYCYDGSYAYTTDPNNVWIRAQELCDYLVSIGGEIIWNPSPSQIDIGDAMFYDWNGGRLDHSAIVSDIIGGTPVVCGHTTNESQSKLDYIWTYGRSANRRCVVKLHGNNCAVPNTALSYDRYCKGKSQSVYNAPGGGVIGSTKWTWTVRVVETRVVNGVTWGKFSYKGTWGWVNLSGSQYLGHTNKFNVDHIFGEWYTVSKPTCITNGEEKRHCNVCGYTETRTTAMSGHVPGAAATCTTPQVCKLCNTTLTPALGHNWGSWYMKTAPTCIQRRVDASRCTRCGYERTQTGDYGAHNWQSTLSVPGCTTDGSSNLKCSYCGETKVDLQQGSWTTTWTTWPSNVNANNLSPEMYKSRTEYRYRDKTYTESTSSSLAGWTLYNTGTYLGDYGNWSNWQDTPVYPSDTRQVETQQAVDSYNYKTVYNYYYYSQAEVGYGTSYYPNSNYGYNKYSVTLDSELTLDGSVTYNGYTINRYIMWHSNNSKYRHVYACYPGEAPYSYTTQEVVSTNYKTQYRYRDRVVNTMYYYWKWQDWSGWQTSAVSATSDRDVETRTTYTFNNAALGHAWGPEKTQNATCYEDGRVYKVCSRCGAETTVRVIAKLNHPSWSAWTATGYHVDGKTVTAEQRHCLVCGKLETRGHTIKSTVVAPTCTEQGYTRNECTDKNCSICKDSGATLVFITDQVDKLGHDMDKNGVEYKKPTCTEDGIRRYYCLRECGHYKDEAISKLGHEYNCTIEKGSCTQDGQRVYTCIRNDDSYTEVITARSHDMGEWVDVVIPTVCGQEGVKQRYCKHDSENDEYVACDYYEEERYTLDHKLTEKVYHEATCLDYGYYEWSCEICGEIYRDDTEEPLGHKWSAWENESQPTCTEDGIDTRHCQRCGLHDENVIPALGHDLVSVNIEGNCSNASGIKYTCVREGCDYNYTEWDGVVVGSHNMGEWVTIKNATCTEPGYKEKQCQNTNASGTQCTYTEREYLPPLGHDYVKNIIAPVCTDHGYIEETCSRCGEYLHYDDPDHPVALGHDMGDWYVVTEATYSETGEEERDCRRCTYYEIRDYGPLEKQTYTATFLCENGEVLEAVEFAKDATKLSHEPDVPTKPGWVGVWESYIVSNRDFEIRPIYTPIDETYIKTEKTAEVSSDESTVTITLSATCDAEEFKSRTAKVDPVDVVLVVDQSGSMANNKMSDGRTRQKALIDAANDLLGYIYQNAVDGKVDHRVAIVGFAYGLYQDENGTKKWDKANIFKNTGILSTTKSEYVKYVEGGMSASDYKNAMMSINANGQMNPYLKKAVDGIAANGATAADYGMEMAKLVLANNQTPENENRKKVVIFLTDGEPTRTSDFSAVVANKAIEHANNIKSSDEYGATIYSIGVNDKVEGNLGTFISRVSSDYTYAAGCTLSSSKIKWNTGSVENADNKSYTFAVSAKDSIKAIFETIWDDTTEVKSKFENITVVDTVSKYFSMSTQQEADFRERTIREYGVRNDQISVVRNDDNTTTVTVQNINPKATADGKYNVTLKFDVSPSNRAANPGVYPTNTADAGIKLDGIDDYEITFAIPSVKLERNDCLAIFMINDMVYETRIIPMGNAVLAPTYEVPAGNYFSGWNTNGLVMNSKCRIFYATLSPAPYSVTWNINGTVKTDWYRAGDVISVPATPKIEEMTFVGWDNEVPVTMPAESLEFTAVYEKHTCNFERICAITEPNCVTSGVYQTKCTICDKLSTENVPATGYHKFVATLSESKNTQEMTIPFICTECGLLSNMNLKYRVTEDNGNIYVRYSLVMTDEDDNSIQPNGSVQVKFPMDEHKLETNHKITAFHVEGMSEDAEIISEVPSYVDNGYIVITCDSFSEYLLIDSHCANEGGSKYRKIIYKLCRILARLCRAFGLIDKDRYDDLIARYSWGWYMTGIYYYNFPNFTIV